MKRVKFLFFINPKSGADNDSDPENIIRMSMLQHQTPFRIQEISEELDARKIMDMIINLHPETVVAAGGDGTVNFIASAIINQPVKLGILPLGSANGLAFELGIPMKTEDAIENLFSGKAQQLDVVRINGQHISLHLSDLGMNARLIKRFEEEGVRGFKGYFKQFFKVLKSPPSFRCTIETPDKKYTHRSLMTVIANSGKYRSGAVINPTGKKDDGRFEVIILKPRKHWIIRNTIAAFTGNFHNQPNIVTYDCTSVKIKVEPQQELQIDGELLGKKNEIQAEILKHALQVIVP